jgi:LPXTG-motif cell wall-anchored protein
MPGGCTATPTTPAAPPTPATPATPTLTPATPTPTPVAQTNEGENVPTAGQGENEETPERGDVEGETSESTPTETTPSVTASPGPTQEASAGTLPFTGSNAWWLGLLGFTAAGTGIVLRRRSSD